MIWTRGSIVFFRKNGQDRFCRGGRDDTNPIEVRIEIKVRIK